MKLKRFGTYSLRFGVGLLSIGTLLMPIQAVHDADAHAAAPKKFTAVTEIVVTAKPEIKPTPEAIAYIPVPSTKPVYEIEPAAGDEAVPEVEMASVEQSHYASLNLTSLLPADIEPISSSIGEQYPHGYKPLSSVQSKKYAKAFQSQMHGQWDAADLVISEIKDKRLMGHVQYQRYMHPSYKSGFNELKEWMDSYADHPYADKIHKLALARQGDIEGDVKAPVKTRLLSQIKEPTIYYPKRYKVQTKRNHAQNIQVRDFSRKVRAMVRSGKTQDALDYLMASETTFIMDSAEIDILKSSIAAGFLYRGQIDQAKVVAVDAALRSGKYAPRASWVAGLALWQKKDYAQAATYFEKVGASAYASGWRSSAGYYWAARSYSRLNDKEKLRTALNNASKHSRTFYGLIATKMLGKSFDFNWHTPEFDREAEGLVLSTDAGQRAFSLVAAGQYDLAEDELMRLKYKGDMKLRRAVLAYAMRVGLPGIALRLGNMVPGEDGKYYDAALYPAAPWEPQDGFNVDPALIHAVMRQESRFNQQAKSYSGALGLMQIMPKTAQYVAQKRGYKQTVNKVSLADPALNMTIGQDYIDYLLKGQYVRGDIISLLIAYNAGPGNLLKWRKRTSDAKDPLLFVETLPVQETRDYVVKVMSNYWIYRLRSGLDVPSLASIADGQSPSYAHAITLPDTYKVSSQ